MKNLIFPVFIYIILKIMLITFAKTIPESNMNEDINAILIPCPKNIENNTCEPHLIINIHMNPSIDLNNLEDTWILDEVYDPTRRLVLRIISPYLIVVGRGEPVVMYPLQYKESIKHKELGKEQRAQDDDKNRNGLPSSQSNGPGPSINMKGREEVKDVSGSPSPKTDQPLPLINIKELEVEPSPEDDANELNPSITMKRIVNDTDVQVSPSDQNNEPCPSITINEPKVEQATENNAKDIQDSPSLKTDEPSPSINLKEQEDSQTTNDDVMASQGILPINTNEPNPTINEPAPSINMNGRVGQDSQYFKTEKSLPSINLKEREDEQATNDDVMARQGIQSIKTSEPNPTINEPTPSINMHECGGEQATGNEVKNVQDSQYLKTDKSLLSINLKEREDAQATNDDFMARQDIQSIKTSELNPTINKPAPSINMNEREGGQATGNEVRNVQDYQYFKTDKFLPSINAKEREDEQATKDDVMARQGIQSIRISEPNPTINEPAPSINFNELEGEQVTGNEVKNVQDSQSLKTDKRLPSINLSEWEDEQPTKEVVNESQGSLSSNTCPSINTKVNKGDKVKGFPLGQNNEPGPSMNMNVREEDVPPTQGDINDSQLQSSKTTNPLNPINMRQLEDIEEIISSPSGETKEPINMDKYDERENLQGLSSNKKIDINVKGREAPIEDDVKNLQESSSRNESEIGDASRLKRHQGLVYTSKKSVGFNIAFRQKTPSKSTNWNPQEPLFDQSGIASLGLIEVRDPSFKKGKMAKPKDLQRVHNNNKKYSQNRDDKKNVFRSYQYDNQELDMNDRNKVTQIDKERKTSLHNTGSWDNQLLDMNPKKNFYQEEKERDYHLKRNKHPDNIKEKDVSLYDQIEQGDKRKHIEEEIKNYKPSLTYNIRNENHPMSIGSYSNENNLPPKNQSLNAFSHEEEGKQSFQLHDSHERTAVRDKFKLPYESLLDIDNAPAMGQNYKYAFVQPPNVSTDLNDRKGEYYNTKTSEHNIDTGNYSRKESVPENDIKNEYYNAKKTNNIFKGNYLSQGRVPEYDKYCNSKTAENSIYTGNDIPQGRFYKPDKENDYYNAKAFQNNIDIKKYLPQERVPEYNRNDEYCNAKTTENIYKASDLIKEIDRNNDYYNAKTTENIFKGSDLIKERVPEIDRKNDYYNAKTTENIYKGSDLIKERVPEYNRKDEYCNAKTTENIYKASDLIKEIDRNNDYYNAKTTDNIFKGNDLKQESVPEYDRKNEYYNAKTTENIYKGSDLIQERVPEYNRKDEYCNAKTTENIYKASDLIKEIDRNNNYYNAQTAKNIYKGSDLIKERVPEIDRKNEYYNAKTTENIYKGSDLIQERVPETDRKNEYYNVKTSENIFKGSDLIKERVSEYDRGNEYCNAKKTENIYKVSDPPKYDRKNEYLNSKPPENSIYKGHDLLQERVPEHDTINEYYNVKTTENFYKGSDIIQERVPEHEIENQHYIAQTAEKIIYTENDLPEERVPEYDRKNEFYNAKTTDNIYKGNDLMQERVPEYDRKNEYYNAEKAENNIHKGYDLHQGRVPELKINDFNAKTAENISRFYYPSSPEGQKFNFNKPISLSNINYTKGHDQSNVNSHASSFPNSTIYSLGRADINSIISQHIRENLQKKKKYQNDQTFDGKNPRTIPYNINPEDPKSTYIFKNGQQFDWKNSQRMPHNFNPKDLYSDLGQPFSHSKFPQYKLFSSYSGTNPYKSVPTNYKRIKRSNSVKSREDVRYENNLDLHKNFNLQKIEENGEVPCDTCGGKNKKKDEKPPASHCSALTEPKSLESKIENFNAQGKLNDVIPCDTCGGKNKKGGGKPLPGGLDSEIHRGKAEIAQKLTAEDMIPCERCKVNREGNLASQSCGCVSNPSVCNCEGSKLSRAPDQSKEDLNYGVFNMNDPIPYLTTQLRIFRRRHNTWWRIVPIVAVDSVSGIFANQNMSMIFSTRVGTLRQEKYARFVDHKLVIPLTSDGQLADTRSIDTLSELEKNIEKSFLLGSFRNDISNREIKNFEDGTVRGIDILGHFPVSMKPLQMCPHNDKNLCLNIRAERVPEFSIKVKIPFRENGFMVTHKHVIKIFSIITDATTKDALHISIDVINKGLEAHEYSIYVYNCPLTKTSLSTTSVRRHLQPDIGQTVTFLLPFINGGKRNKKFSCDVVVKESDLNNSNKSFFMKSADVKDGIIAKRPMDIMVHSRCFCIARCRCHCMEKLQTFVNYKVCERMSRTAEEEAGLIYNCPPGNEKNDVCITDLSCDSHKKTSFNLFYNIQSVILIILMWLLIFGLLKAIFGLCIQSIDKWGFETVQPGRYYACTSRIRIFIVNVFLFFIYPFACWCKCFKPKPEDLMAASTDWSCNHEMDDGDCSLGANKNSEQMSRLSGGAQKLSENLLLAFAPHYENGLFRDDKPDDEESTAFILEVLEESKSSLSKMMSQSTKSSESPEIVSACAENSEEERTAEELVENLKNSQRAYRIMSTPVGGVTHIPQNCQYCVKGFFLPTIKGTYEFISYHPLVQYIGISEENEVKKLMKPEYLHTDEFLKNYANKLEVLRAGDLSVVCPPNIPCINITPLNDLESSFVKLSALLKEEHTD